MRSAAVDVRSKLIRNFCTDPQATVLNSGGAFAISTSRWFGGTGGTGTHTVMTGQTDGPLPGLTSYVRKRWSTAAPGNGDTGVALSKATVQPGAPITLSVYMRASIDRAQCGIYFTYYDAGGATISTKTATRSNLLAGAWSRFSMTDIVPAGAATVGPVSDVDTPAANGFWQPGDTLDITGILAQQSPYLNPYSDGDTPGWMWLGTQKASASVGFPYRLEPIAGVPTVQASGSDLAVHTGIAIRDARTAFYIYTVTGQPSNGAVMLRMGGSQLYQLRVRFIAASSFTSAGYLTFVVGSGGGTTDTTLPNNTSGLANALTPGTHVLAISSPAGATEARYSLDGGPTYSVPLPTNDGWVIDQVWNYTTPTQFGNSIWVFPWVDDARASAVAVWLRSNLL